MKTGYLVTHPGGAFVKNPSPKNPHPNAAPGQKQTQRVYLEQGTWVPDYVAPGALAHLVDVGLVTPIRLDAKMTYDPSMLPPTKRVSMGSITELLAELRLAGVTEIPGLADYEKLVPLARKVPAPEAPPVWLGLDPDTAADALREQLYYEKSCLNVSNPLSAALPGEFASVLAAYSDSLIEQMRPAFDAAADKARELVEMGVTDSDTHKSLFDRPDAVRDAWRTFQYQGAFVLDKALGARIKLSQVTQTPPDVERNAPDSEAFDWSIVVTYPFRPRAIARKTGAEPSWCRWLRAADVLHLPLMGELDLLTVMQSGGLEVPDQAPNMLITEEN